MYYKPIIALWMHGAQWHCACVLKHMSLLGHVVYSKALERARWFWSWSRGLMMVVVGTTTRGPS